MAVHGYWIEPNRLEVSHHDLKSLEAGEPIRIAQLSDLHPRAIDDRARGIAERLAGERLDQIVLSGDVVDRPEALPVLDRYLGMLGPTPKVAVLGNWEYWGAVDLTALRRIHQRRGVRLLVNQATTYRFGTRSLRVVGFDDHAAGDPDPRILDTASGMEARSAMDTILVQHSPGWFEQEPVRARRDGFRPCLSGHTHGGLVRLPGLPVWTPPGSGRFRAGWYPLPVRALYVSRGIGTSVLPIRIGARPELAIFVL